MHIQFKSELNNKNDAQVAITTIPVSGAPLDSALKINATVTQVLLPIDIHNESTTFIFQYASAPSDTLQVGYSSQIKIIAKDCGAFTYYQNLKILYTSFKESRIKEFSKSLLVDPTLYAGNRINPSAYAVNYQIFY